MPAGREQIVWDPPGPSAPAPPPAGTGSGDPGDLKLSGTARLVFAILLRETVRRGETTRVTPKSVPTGAESEATEADEQES